MFQKIRARLFQIWSFSKLATSPWEMIKLTILGVARGHAFSCDDFIGCLGNKLFPEITCLPAYPGRKLISLDTADIGHLISFHEIIIRRDYNMQLVEFIPESIIDCGAHIGLFTIVASNLNPEARMVSFEPNPSNIVWLRRNIKSNKLDCQIIEAAVSDHNDNVKFYSKYSNGGHVCEKTENIDGSYNVQLVDLADFLCKFMPTSLLLKIDIEGEERVVFPAILPILPEECAVFFETHNGDEGWLKVESMLTNSGFSVYKLSEVDCYYNGFAIRNYV